MLWANSAAATECTKVRASPKSRRLQIVQRPALRAQSASLTLSLIAPRETCVSLALPATTDSPPLRAPPLCRMSNYAQSVMRPVPCPDGDDSRQRRSGQAWTLTDGCEPDADDVPLDLHATAVIAHSDKRSTASIWKKASGFPFTAFIDHGPGGTGKATVVVLRPGNAASNTAADTSTPPAWPWPIFRGRYGAKVLIRTDLGDGTHGFLDGYLGRDGAYRPVRVQPR